MVKTNKYQQRPEEYNPFTAHTDYDKLRLQFNNIDNKDLRVKFKTTKNDSITYAFDAIVEDTVTNLAVDFVRESFGDIISFVSHILD